MTRKALGARQCMCVWLQGGPRCLFPEALYVCCWDGVGPTVLSHVVQLVALGMQWVRGASQAVQTAVGVRCLCPHTPVVVLQGKALWR